MSEIPNETDCGKWEAYMNDVKNNNPGSSAPGDDDDSDLALYASDPDLAREIAHYEHMSPEEVQRQLDRLGIDPKPTIEAVTRLVREKLEEWHSRGLLHPQKPFVTHVFAESPGHDPMAVVSGETAATAWDETHAIACRLRNAGTLREQRAVILETFEHHGVAADVLRTTRCAVDLDAAWPLTESLEEAAIEVADQTSLWDVFSSAYASLAARSSTQFQCMLVHAVKELLERGAAAQHLAGRICAHMIAGDLSDDARVLLVHLANRFLIVKTHIGDALTPIPADLRHLYASIEELRYEALESFPKLRAAKEEFRYFESEPVVKLLESLHSGHQLSAFLSMYALGDVYLCGATLVAQDPRERQKIEHSLFAEKMLERLRDDSLSHFLTIETFEPIRERYPGFAAALMERLAPSVSASARQALFVCLVEGYEQSFHGARQKFVPYFDLHPTPSFVPGTPHDLDLFGSRICGSEVAQDLRKPMKWANDRLLLWQQPAA
jgi:hypothetical protein